MSKRGRVIFIIIGIVLFIVLAAVIALAICVNMGNANLHSPFSGVETPKSASSSDSGKTIEYKGHTYLYNANVVSVLVEGYDDESVYATRKNASCSDANVLVTLDTSTNKVRCITVPRDSMVGVDVYKDGVYQTTSTMQLCLAYAADTGSDKKCAQNVANSVSRLFYNVPIKYYFALGEKSLEEITREVDGVSLTALATIPGTDIRKGEQMILEGSNAYQYVHYRDITVPKSALSRQTRQMQFVKAFMAKARTLGVPTIASLFSSIGKQSVTNLGASELSYLASCFITGDNATVEMDTLEGTTKLDKTKTHEEYYLNKGDVLQTMLNTYYTRIN